MEIFSHLPVPEQVTSMVFAAMLVFCRIGTAFIMLPGIGDNAIPPRTKIALGVIVTLLVSAHQPIQVVIDPPSAYILLMASEVLIGGFIGTGARIILSSLHVLGAQIGFAAGLSNALAPNDGNYESAGAISSLMTMTALALLFAVDAHHIFIRGVVDSYAVFPPNGLYIGDMAQQIARLGASTFYTATMIGAPFFAIALLANFGLGLANRVMPAMQVFFVAAPGLILICFVILALSLPSITEHVVTLMTDWFQSFKW